MRTKRIAIVEISGGLGNQLFQLGAAKYLSSHFDDVYIDYSPNSINDKRRTEIRDLVHQMGMKEYSYSVFISKLLSKLRIWKFSHILRGEKLVSEIVEFEIPRIVKAQQKLRYRGYWQNKTVAMEIKDEVLAWLNPIRSEAVAVHLRRGDYAEQDNRNHHGLLSIDYFNRAISQIQVGSKINLYSDSPIPADWFGELSKRFYLEDLSNLGTKETLRSIVGCNQIIISNSTFSWWGGFLSNAELVISPSVWSPRKETPNSLIFQNMQLVSNEFN